MTPDMKRLVDVASHVMVRCDHDFGNSSDNAEAIVRAVLTELGPPSEAMEQIAIGYTAEVDGKVVCIGEAVCDGFTAMIDHILAEPATA